jgi:hypothetical protein
MSKSNLLFFEINPGFREQPSCGINVAGVHKYLVSFTMLKTLLYFLNTQLDFVILFHTNWIPSYFHSGIYHCGVLLLCSCNTPVK